MERKNLKQQHIKELLLIVGIVITINLVASVYFVRYDLTSEKRYTLSQTSKELLKSISDPILVKIYLHGDLPIAFKKFEQSIKETLEEFRIYAGNKIQYEFIDPYESNNQRQVDATIENLYKKGLQPTNVKIKDKKGGYSEKIVIPGAIISANNIDFPVNLLSNNPILSGEENLNNSLQNLEYNFINAIYCVTNKNVSKIAFIEGHGEWDEYHTGDIMRELANYFQVDRGVINGNIESLRPYKCIIIAGPQQNFSEEDKFVIDQYIMNGGKVIWLIDPVSINRDSLTQGNTFASLALLNLEDQLFKYGIRINPVLIQDLQCAIIPVSTGFPSNQSKFIPAPWVYYPLLSGSMNHPISRNLNLIRTEFCSYIDTLSVNEIKHTVLLTTSKFSKVKNVPAFVSLSEIKKQPNEQEFNLSYLPVAVLSEGVFQSVFQHRILSALHIKGHYTFKPQSINTKMIFIADADIIKNDVRETPQGILISKLGYDRYTNQTYGNKDFIVNAINYLTDDNNLVSLRSKFVQLRLLDKARLNDKLYFFQLLNIILPLILMAIAAIFIVYWRKHKFAK